LADFLKVDKYDSSLPAIQETTAVHMLDPNGRLNTLQKWDVTDTLDKQSPCRG
jgi:hypothetical protein